MGFLWGCFLVFFRFERHIKRINGLNGFNPASLTASLPLKNEGGKEDDPPAPIGLVSVPFQRRSVQNFGRVYLPTKMVDF